MIDVAEARRQTTAGDDFTQYEQQYAQQRAQQVEI
jgi:hypothetical protein